MVLHQGGDYQEMISGVETPSSTPVAEDVPKLRWIETHPYIASIIGIGGLLFLGAALVMGRNDVDPSRTSGAWGGAGGIFFNSGRKAAPVRPTSDDAAKIDAPADSYAVIPIFKPASDNPSESNNDDIMSVLAQLVKTVPISAAPYTATQSEGYAYIPRGLLSVDPQPEPRSRTVQALFAYGNDIGTYIKGFEDSHSHSPQIMKDHIENRTDPQKQRRLKLIGADMEQLGADMVRMEELPVSVKSLHTAYAKAYVSAGVNLQAVADSSSDEQFVETIATYNASVETLSQAFQSLVINFGVHEVTFSSNDPGNIFTFSPTLGLPQ